MSAPEDLWRTKDGKVAIFRLVYHARRPGDREPPGAVRTAQPAPGARDIAAAVPAAGAGQRWRAALRRGSGPRAHQRRRRIGEVLEAYGRAEDAGNSFSGRCELSHTFGEVCRFTFTPKQDDEPS